jgi:cell division septum initiation protein DivIVA
MIMYREDPSSSTSSPGSFPDRTNSMSSNRAFDFDLERELNRLEETILDSPRIPLSRRTLVDEDKLLNQLDLVRMNLPEALEKAIALLSQQQEILSDAQEDAQRILQSAQHRAAQILDQTGIIQQAQRQAEEIFQQTQQECEALRQETIAEVEQMRYVAQQELQEIYQRTQHECAEIQNGADEYADRVLNNIELQLDEMLHIVRNGRQQIASNPSSRSHSEKKLPPKTR